MLQFARDIGSGGRIDIEILVFPFAVRKQWIVGILEGDRRDQDETCFAFTVFLGGRGNEPLVWVLEPIDARSPGEGFVVAEQADECIGAKDPERIIDVRVVLRPLLTSHTVRTPARLS